MRILSSGSKGEFLHKILFEAVPHAVKTQNHEEELSIENQNMLRKSQTGARFNEVALGEPQWGSLACTRTIFITTSV
jgi:hypothetical protein